MQNIKSLFVSVCVVALAGCSVESADSASETEAIDSQAQALHVPVKYTVDTPADFADGSCVAWGDSGGRCTLRAAIAAADMIVGETIVELRVDPVVSLGQINIAGSVNSKINIQSQFPDTRRASITGSQNSRLFQIYNDATVILHNLSMQGFSGQSGGIIFNGGTLKIRRSMLANGTVACSSSGVQTAYASCSGGAIYNTGLLEISEGTRFESNRVTAYASTAANVTATAGGGAIWSGGTMVITPPVAFVSNSITANAQGGYRPTLPGGAYAGSFGGAISGHGLLTINDGAPGSCEFLSNSATATASAIEPNPSEAESAGGAISQNGQLVVPAACVFHNNVAAVSPDVYVTP